MIGLILGIVILCVIVYIIFTLLPVPANVQKVVWLLVAVVILVMIANFFGFGPDWSRMGGHGGDVRVH